MGMETGSTSRYLKRMGKNSGGDGVRSSACYVFDQLMRCDIKVIESCMKSKKRSTNVEGGLAA